MSNCEAVKDVLVLYLEGELSAEDRARVDEHLGECAACRGEVAHVQSVRSWLADPDLFLPENYPWEFLPRALAACAVESPSVKWWLPVNFGRWGWAASVACMLVVGFGVIWMAHRPSQVPDPGSKTAEGNEAFLRQMQSAYVRESTADYLTQCQDLLLNVIRAEKSCEGEKHDVSLEISRARALLRRKRLLDPELRRPEVARARQVCDELENFLLELSTSERCESSDKLTRLEQVIRKEQLLLRIQLLKAELS